MSRQQEVIGAHLAALASEHAQSGGEPPTVEDLTTYLCTKGLKAGVLRDNKAWLLPCFASELKLCSATAMRQSTPELNSDNDGSDDDWGSDDDTDDDSDDDSDDDIEIEPYIERTVTRKATDLFDGLVTTLASTVRSVKCEPKKKKEMDFISYDILLSHQRQ